MSFSEKFSDAFLAKPGAYGAKTKTVEAAINMARAEYERELSMKNSLFWKFLLLAGIQIAIAAIGMCFFDLTALLDGMKLQLAVIVTYIMFLLFEVTALYNIVSCIADAMGESYQTVNSGWLSQDRLTMTELELNVTVLTGYILSAEANHDINDSRLQALHRLTISVCFNAVLWIVLMALTQII